MHTTISPIILGNFDINPLEQEGGIHFLNLFEHCWKSQIKTTVLAGVHLMGNKKAPTRFEEQSCCIQIQRKYKFDLKFCFVLRFNLIRMNSLLRKSKFILFTDDRCCAWALKPWDSLSNIWHLSYHKYQIFILRKF